MAQGGRLVWLDLARTAAIAGMVVFHFARDLEMFGLAAPGMTMQGGWPVFARAVAGSFLALSGASLWFAAAGGLSLHRFRRRFAQIAGAAALVSVATRIALPDAWVMFGILHMMAAASLIGPLFLRLPAVAAFAAAVLALVLSDTVFLPAFDTPLLVWTGLGTTVPRSIDYVPVIPWIAPYLAGFGLARLVWPAGPGAAAAGPAGRFWRGLGLPGRHSLAVYLVHQPVLIALIWLWQSVFG
jgi:uncharacterized membrane protein